MVAANSKALLLWLLHTFSFVMFSLMSSQFCFLLLSYPSFLLNRNWISVNKWTWTWTWTKNDVTSGKKSSSAAKLNFQYGIIVLSVSRMPIFRNRPDIFNVLFGRDKQNFVFFLVTSVFWRTGQLVIQNTPFWRPVFHEMSSFLRRWIPQESLFAWKWWILGKLHSIKISYSPR